MKEYWEKGGGFFFIVNFFYTKKKKKINHELGVCGEGEPRAGN